MGKKSLMYHTDQPLRPLLERTDRALDTDIHHVVVLLAFVLDDICSLGALSCALPCNNSISFFVEQLFNEIADYLKITLISLPRL